MAAAKSNYSFASFPPLWTWFKAVCGWTDQLPKRASDTAWLDGLRGVAALQVFIFHLWGRHLAYLHTYGSSNDDYHIYQLLIFRPIWAGGPGAVDVFFVISGYVLSHKCLVLMRRQQYDLLFKSLCSSVFRRPFRLFMPVLLVALPTLVLTRAFDMSSGFTIPDEAKVSIWAELAWLVRVVDSYINPFHDHNLNETGMPLVPPAWTIPLEYNGSLVIYLAIPLVTQFESFRVRASVLTMLATYTLHRGQWWVSNFVVGMLLSDWMQESKTDLSSSEQGKWWEGLLKPRTFFSALAVIVGCYLSGLPPHWLGDETPKVGYEFLYGLYPPHGLVRLDEQARWYWYWAGNLTVLGISQLPSLRAVLESKFCQWLGKISFALYLSHTHVITLGGPIADPLAVAVSQNAFWVCLVALFTQGPIVFVVAGLVERFVDRPCVRWARAFEEWCRGSVGGEPAPEMIFAATIA